MKLNRFNFFLGLLFISLFFSGIVKASNYTIVSIPPHIKEGSVAVLRSLNATFIQHDTNNGTYKVHKVITILNTNGNKLADFYSYKDNFVDFKKFEGIIRDGNGKEIKKIKKKDLIESSISNQMASDDKILFYEVTSPVFPYTVEYSYEQQFKNGIIAYPSFHPIDNFQMAVEKANLTVELPAGQDLRYLSNFNCDIKEEKTDKAHLYKFSTSGLKAIEREPYLSSDGDVFPRVRISVKDFCFDKVCGNMSTWKDFGLWQNKLLENRDILPQPFVDTIKNLTKDASTNKEKVAILYDYLQKNTRYVSIQLGIGGWQPISAESTIKNNYGDCKGLTNLMKAMLKVIDIPSYYTTIYMGSKKTLLKDFPDMSQTNHVILLVPLANDSIWLECTSNSLPMGYVHDDIAGHDAIVMTAEGGKVCTLPSYTSSENLAESVTVLNVKEDGNLEGEFVLTEHLHGFSTNQSIIRSNDRSKHVNYINRYLNFPTLNIGTIHTSENLSDLPFCTLSADFKASNYITKTGQRLFIPLVPLKKNYFNTFKSKERKQDIVIDYGFCERDSVIFNLPEGYVLESKPKNILYLTEYGSLLTFLKQTSDNQITFSLYIEVKEGRYDREKYNEIKNFYQAIVASTKAKLVVRKE